MHIQLKKYANTSFSFFSKGLCLRRIMLLFKGIMLLHFVTRFIDLSYFEHQILDITVLEFPFCYGCLFWTWNLLAYPRKPDLVTHGFDEFVNLASFLYYGSCLGMQAVGTDIIVVNGCLISFDMNQNDSSYCLLVQGFGQREGYNLKHIIIQL